MIRRGFCLRSNHHPRHIYVVLNEPGSNGEILFVNFTTRQLPQHAKEEIFTGADYQLLYHESVVAFWKAHPRARSDALQSAIGNGDFSLLPDLPAQTLDRIIAAAKDSPHLSIEQKRLLP